VLEKTAEQWNALADTLKSCRQPEVGERRGVVAVDEIVRGTRMVRLLSEDRKVPKDQWWPVRRSADLTKRSNTKVPKSANTRWPATSAKCLIVRMAFSTELWRIMAARQALECEEDHSNSVIKITNCRRACLPVRLSCIRRKAPSRLMLHNGGGRKCRSRSLSHSSRSRLCCLSD
jgi:hypothetical protein